MIRIHIFHTGNVVVDQAIPYKEKNPLAVTGFLRGREKKVTLPVSCYLITHPAGNVLIDTGWDSRYARKSPHAILNHISSPVIGPGESVDYKLAGVGLAPSDLSHIFLSHLDFDHTSGLRLVKAAKCISAAEEELADSKRYACRYVRSNWDGINIQPFSYRQTGIGPVGRSYDAFGDGKVVLVNTPGHTHGLFSAKIAHNGTYVVLAGDTIYTQRSIREKIIPGFTVNADLARRSLEWIADCAADENCLLVAANHDPSIREQIIEL